jgi:hypothetical protein
VVCDFAADNIFDATRKVNGFIYLFRQQMACRIGEENSVKPETCEGEGGSGLQVCNKEGVDHPRRQVNVLSQRSTEIEIEIAYNNNRINRLLSLGSPYFAMLGLT